MIVTWTPLGIIGLILAGFLFGFGWAIAQWLWAKIVTRA